MIPEHDNDRNKLAKLESIQQSVHSWAQMFDDTMTTNVNQLEGFNNHLWVTWFEIFIETYNEVFVERGESASKARKNFVSVTAQPRHIRSKFDCLLKVADYEIGAAKHRHVLLDNDAKSRIYYLNVGKVMHEIMRQNAAPHIVSMVTTVTKIMLLFMAYGAGYVTLLRTKSFKISAFYRQYYMQTMKTILTYI